MPHSTMIFDLDGTLSDPALGVVCCTNFALTSFDLPPRADHEITRHICPPFNHTLALLSGSDDVYTTVAYTALASSVMLSVPAYFVWITPQTNQQLILLTLMALLAGLAEFMVIKALQIAHAGLVAPVQYTILLWGTIYGLILFADIPDIFTFIGASIIIASGLYTVHRERLRQAD